MESPASRVVATSASRARRSRRLLTSVAVAVPTLLVAMLLAVLGARWWLGRFLHSEDFRRFLERKVSATLQAEATLEPLRWTGSEVYTAGFSVQATSEGPLTAFQADDLRATFDLGALRRRVWRVETVDVQRITADLGPTATTQRAPIQPSPDKVAPPGAGSLPLAFLLPNRMEVGELRVADFNLGWDGGRLQGTRLEARMQGDVGSWEVEGAGGTLAQVGFPAIALDRFAVRTTRETVFVTRASGRPAGGGSLELSGSLGTTGAHPLDLSIGLEGIPIDPFLPRDWRGRLAGKAAVRAQVTGSGDSSRNLHASGHFDLRDGQVEALPVLDQLALFSSSARYRRAPVQRGGADFTWTADDLRVQNLLVESDGLMKVEGGFTVRAGQIDGTFRVGVAVSSIRWVNGLAATVFNLPQHDGYAWTTMRVTGPVDHPREDLTGRLAAAAGETLLHKAQQGGDAALDAASSLLDLLRGSR